MSSDAPAENARAASRNFIEQIIDADRAAGKNGGRVHTRFPPEPNGYLHIGHAKSICLNFGLAQEYGGKFNLRFDDTNPTKEEQEYVDSIIDDVRWLGVDWEDRLFYASDYFEQLYDWAVQLIKDGKAYVCDLTAEEMREYRGTLTEPGKNSPYPRSHGRGESRPVRADEEGRVPRRRPHAAREDRHGLAELNLRDPVMYRILHASIIAPATSGASTRCTTTRTARATRSKASRTRSARWSSRTIGRSTTGSSTSWASTTRSRSSSPG